MASSPFKKRKTNAEKRATRELLNRASTDMERSMVLSMGIPGLVMKGLDGAAGAILATTPNLQDRAVNIARRTDLPLPLAGHVARLDSTEFDRLVEEFKNDPDGYIERNLSGLDGASKRIGMAADLMHGDIPDDLSGLDKSA